VLGIADPTSAAPLAALGCDTFDSCYATRAGRHGTLLTDGGPLRVASGQHKSAFRPPVEGCGCATCRRHSLAYLHHLVKAKEPLAAALMTVHNIHYMCRVMARLREAIQRDEL
jgi:queuine tRNA-ribosyltransferase